MLVALDVDYGAATTSAAFVTFSSWSDDAPHEEGRATFPPCTDAYQPGEFFRRELPYLLAVVRGLKGSVNLVIVNGYVWLGDERPGLGAHLHEHLGGVPVVGVAKRPFHGNTKAVEVRRGQSLQPLFVTAVGFSVAEAAASVASMAGRHRIPTLLKRVNRIARGG